MNPAVSSIWVLGAGYFGKIALASAINRYPHSGITVVDQNPDALEDIRCAGVQTVCMEAARFVHQHLHSIDSPQWIIPVVPIHLTWEWIQLKLLPEQHITPIDVPLSIRKILPNAMPGKIGEMYVSIADFQCPENCPEPAARCTHTGLPRPLIMHDFLESRQFPSTQSVVVRSRQLGPGVGGYSPADLFSALKTIERSTGPILLSTACKCHGVVQFLTKS